MIKPEDLRQISNDNIPEEVIKREITAIENQMTSAAEEGKMLVSVMVPINLSEKVFETLEKEGYRVTTQKAKNAIKMTITW